ncbi:unnamed protein product [Caenorhabditis nigoni]
MKDSFMQTEDSDDDYFSCSEDVEDDMEVPKSTQSVDLSHSYSLGLFVSFSCAAFLLRINRFRKESTGRQSLADRSLFESYLGAEPNSQSLDFLSSQRSCVAKKGGSSTILELLITQRSCCGQKGGSIASQSRAIPVPRESPPKTPSTQSRAIPVPRVSPPRSTAEVIRQLEKDSGGILKVFRWKKKAVLQGKTLPDSSFGFRRRLLPEFIDFSHRWVSEKEFRRIRVSLKSSAGRIIDFSPKTKISEKLSQMDSDDEEKLRKEREALREDQRSIDSATWMDVDELKLLEERQIPSTSSPPPPMIAADGNQEGQGTSTDMLKRERIATASSSKSHEEPKLDSRVVESLRSMIKDLELDKKLLEEENRSLKTSSSVKKVLGRSEGEKWSQSKENEKFQRQNVDRTGVKVSGGRKPIEGSMPGEYFLEKERARESVHNETMNGYSPEYGGEEQKFFAKPHYQSSWDMGRSSEMAMFAMMQQMRTEDRLPEPPKYTAEEKSTSLEAFIRIFKLKYGRLSDDQQMILLEANFLGGKALKVFKSIPEYEKESFETVIAAMSDRLRVSEADESHRAKTRWEQLRRRENETVEDYCLALDELAKRAFVGISPRQIASIKIAKLLSAIASNEYMASAVQDKIDDLPQVEQYEAARKKAIRMERGMLERAKIRQEASGSDKKSDKKWSGDKDNRNGFNSPSQNYQANPSNKNVQFSSSSICPQSFPSSENQLSQSNQQSLGDNVYQAVPNDEVRQSNDDALGFQGCGECKRVGFHEPSCSKAPKGSKSCFVCQSPDHFARSCPQKVASKQLSTDVTKYNASVSTLEYVASSMEVNAWEEGKICRSKCEDGKIAGVDVELMIDSGATVSIMSEDMWKHIVKVKGKEWERNVVKEPVKQNVRAANNELINMLFQVVLETSLRCKTTKIPICVAKVSRRNVILGFNNFEALGIQLCFEDNHRSIRLMRDILLAPRSQEIVEVWVEGYFSDQKCCVVHPVIDQLSASVCQVSKNGKSFLMLCNSGEDSVMLEKSQVIAQGEIKELEKLRDEVSKESTEQVCPMMKEEVQEERVTRSEHIENQLIEVESMSVSRSTRNEKEECELIGKKAVDIELCQGPPLKSFINSSSQDCLQEDKIPDHGDRIISAELEPDKGHGSGRVPESVNVSPDPSEKEGDVAEQADPQMESSRHLGVLSPGKDPPGFANLPREPTWPLKDPTPSCQPQYEHHNDPPKRQLQYDQGSSMCLHSKPSTST